MFGRKKGGKKIKPVDALKALNLETKQSVVTTRNGNVTSTKYEKISSRTVIVNESTKKTTTNIVTSKLNDDFPSLSSRSWNQPSITDTNLLRSKSEVKPFTSLKPITSYSSHSGPSKGSGPVLSKLPAYKPAVYTISPRPAAPSINSIDSKLTTPTLLSSSKPATHTIPPRPTLSSVNPIKSYSSPNVLKEQPYVVKKTDVRYDTFSMTKVPIYKTSSKERGNALIINNVKFHDSKHNREGAVKDERDIANVLGQIGFKIKVHRDSTASNMINQLKDFAKHKHMKTGDISLVVVMSHGSTNNIPGGFTEVMGIDGKGVSTDHIISQMDEQNCRAMLGKPKIFIFQCCRSMTQVDAIPFRAEAGDKSNMLIAHSTIPGFFSHRNPVLGTWYIQTICEVFCSHAHEFDIESLLKIVDDKLYNQYEMKQVTSYESRGFKRCYLHPQ